MSTILRIKRMGKVLGQAVQILLGLVLLLGLSSLAVKWITGRDLQDAFRFPEVVVLPLWSALSLLLVTGLLVVCTVYLESRLSKIETELTSIDSTLRDLQPLVEEGRAIWTFNAEREADQYMSQEEDPPPSPER